MPSPEILFTEDELKQILFESETNEDLRNPKMMRFGKQQTTVIALSLNTGLILAQGNEHTGFKHIEERHMYSSGVHYWRDDKWDNPSKMHPLTFPSRDFLTIADCVYKPENLNPDKNKRPELFDVYFGKYEGINAASGEQFNLVLYKGTKVVHSLYPQRSTFNQKRVKDFPFVRSRSEGSHHVKDSIFDIKIFYRNHLNEHKYTLVIRMDGAAMTETYFVYVIDADGKSTGRFPLGQNTLNAYDPTPMSMLHWEQGDIRYLEEHIKRIDSQLKREAFEASFLKGATEL